MVIQVIAVVTAGVVGFMAYKIGQVHAELEDRLIELEREKIEFDKKWSVLKGFLDR